MTLLHNLTRSIPMPALLILIMMGLTLGANAQNDQPRPGADTPGERGDRGRQSRWRIPDDATSENNRMLERILQRYPDSDTDEDGKLNAAEARAFIEKQRQQWRERGNWRRNRIEPTFDNIKYGPDDKHHFDLYRAKSEGPAPLAVFFHGGQFITGDERSTGTLDVRALLDAGISVASIDYRETNEAPFPGPFNDAAKAIQFIRFYAEQLHIDPSRIAGHGEEAGGNLALYLALHDDLFDQAARDKLEEGAIKDPREALPEGPIRLADQDEAANPSQPAETDEPADDLGEQPGDEPVEKLDDLVLEELIPWDSPALDAMSTRLAAVVARHPIATFDPRAWEKHKLPMNDHERLMTKYLDVRYLKPLNDPVVIAIVEQVSPLSLITRGDPPLLLLSQYEDLPLSDNTIWTIMRHHPRQSQLIASEMRSKGNDTTVRYKGMRNDPGTSSIDFLIENLK